MLAAGRMSMVTSPRPPAALCCTATAAGSASAAAADRRRRTLRLVLKPMSCCGILGKKSKRSSPSECETPLQRSLGCTAAGVSSAPAATAAASSSGCLPSSRASRPPDPRLSTVAAPAPAAASHKDSSVGAGVGQPLNCAAAAAAAAAATATAVVTAEGAARQVGSAAAGTNAGPSLVTSGGVGAALSPAPTPAALPCSGGSVQLLSAEELVELLGFRGAGREGGEVPAASAVLLLDCRAFMSYNHDHVRGAINVSCTSKCTQKRMRHGRIGDFITSSEGKELFRGSEHVVVYDDTTVDLGGMTEALSVLVSALLKEGKAVHVLRGGMQSFRERFHGFCTTSELPAAAATTSAADHKDPVSGQLTLPRSSPHAASRSEALDEAAMNNEANGSVPLMEHPPSAILSFLFIGNESDASNLDSLKRLGVTHVLNATTHAPCTYEHGGGGLALKYKRLPVKDTMQQNMQPYFSEAIQFIEDARASGGRVLVHCHAGVSRSATLAIAYLLSRSRLSTLEAYEYVKQRRHVISPNINFMGQLVEYEKTLSSGSSGSSSGDAKRRDDDSLHLDPL